jgi:predicted RNase H-like HicB family nuclease
MVNLKYVVYQEGKYYVSQCLNVDVSSFGKTINEAVKNLTMRLNCTLEMTCQRIRDFFMR